MCYGVRAQQSEKIQVKEMLNKKNVDGLSYMQV